MARKNRHYPRVWRNATKGDHRAVAIVYWKRVEYYGEAGNGEASVRIYHENEEDGTFNPFHEEEMLKEGGFKRVHEGEEIRRAK